MYTALKNVFIWVNNHLNIFDAEINYLFTCIIRYNNIMTRDLNI